MRINSFYPLAVIALCLFFSCTTKNTVDKMTTNKQTTLNGKASYAMVIHGGAGTILKKNMTKDKEDAIRKVMNEALSVGEEILKAGGSSLDAIEKTIMVLENSPYFNAGKGAVFNNAGENEMDASIMDGKTINAGAVGGVSIVKNPITAARAVMERSEHVLLTGEGANVFAREQGLEIVDPSYFRTEARWKSLQKAKEREGDTGIFMEDEIDSPFKYGTVGAAAVDKQGNLAAATSTGGMTNKRYNRLGDSPIIGAGTYANNSTCAVSCTGHGEFFIRYAVAYDVSALMDYKGLDLKTAANHVVNEKLKEAGGSGGLIAVDKLGNVAMPFNTPGMYRGYVKPGERAVKIYQD